MTSGKWRMGSGDGWGERQYEASKRARARARSLAAVFVTEGGSQQATEEEGEAGRCFTDAEEEEHLSAPGRDKVEVVGGMGAGGLPALGAF